MQAIQCDKCKAVVNELMFRGGFINYQFGMQEAHYCDSCLKELGIVG